VITPDLSRAEWKTSSRSSGNGQCVECADLGHVIAVRDSKDPISPVLIFTPAGWTSFLRTLRTGRLS
jgi:hypothetical protein